MSHNSKEKEGTVKGAYAKQHVDMRGTYQGTRQPRSQEENVA